MPQCKRCQKSFTPEQQRIQRGSGEYCSLGCQVGRRYQAKPGRPRTHDHRYITKNGYISVKVGREQSTSGYQLEHRLVMERYLGRRLRSDEHVHHRDGNRQNNDLSNLEVLSNAEHQRMHDWPITHQRSRIFVPCAWPGCDRTKEVVSSRLKTYKHIYCSNEHRLMALHAKCHSTAMAKRPPSLMCYWCAQAFYDSGERYKNAKFCSKACADAAKVTDNPEKPCERCGTMFHKRFTSETAKARFCSEACACRTMTERRMAM